MTTRTGMHCQSIAPTARAATLSELLHRSSIIRSPLRILRTIRRSSHSERASRSSDGWYGGHAGRRHAAFRPARACLERSALGLHARGGRGLAHLGDRCADRRRAGIFRPGAGRPSADLPGLRGRDLGQPGMGAKGRRGNLPGARLVGRPRARRGGRGSTGRRGRSAPGRGRIRREATRGSSGLGNFD